MGRSFTTGWNHQRVQPRPLCSNRYRNDEPLKLTRRAKSDLLHCGKQPPKGLIKNRRQLARNGYRPGRLVLVSLSLKPSAAGRPAAR
jgi:hypothetical protein